MSGSSSVRSALVSGDVDGDTPEDVAKAWLVKKGFVGE
jgi:hypothetical protein